jgi:hypothetical protein
MINDRTRNAKYYREKAREIRRFATYARSPDVRLQLLDLADLFDRMAVHVEGRINSQDEVDEDLERPIVWRPPQFRPFKIDGVALSPLG